MLCTVKWRMIIKITNRQVSNQVPLIENQKTGRVRTKNYVQIVLRLQCH